METRITITADRHPSRQAPRPNEPQRQCVPPSDSSAGNASEPRSRHELFTSVDRQLDQLGAKSAVDEEFAKLKAEVGAGPQRQALPAVEGEARSPQASDAGELEAGSASS